MDTMQGNWYTPQLGSLLVKHDVVHVASTGAKFRLELVPPLLVKDGQVRLYSKGQSWLAQPVDWAEELHWKPNDTSRATVVWTREFTSVQGRWEASAFGSLTVAGSAVQYDSIASPFRLFYDGGQLALLDWRAFFLETGDVRWTKQGQSEGPEIIWRPLREGLRMRRSGLRCSQRTALQRSIAQVRNALVQGPIRRLAKAMRSTPLRRSIAKVQNSLVQGPSKRPVRVMRSTPLQRSIAQVRNPLVQGPSGRPTKVIRSMPLRQSIAKVQNSLVPGPSQSPEVTRSKPLRRSIAKVQNSLVPGPSQSPVKVTRSTPLRRSIAPIQKSLVQGPSRQPAKVMRSTPLRRSIAKVKKSLVQGHSGRPAKDMQSRSPLAHLPLSKEAKAELQTQLDSLDEGAFDDILEFLRPELGNDFESQETEIRFDVDKLSPRRQQALAARVRKSLRCQLRAVAGSHV